MDGSSSTPAKGGSGAKGGRKKATTSPKQKEGGDGRGRKQKKDASAEGASPAQQKQQHKKKNVFSTKMDPPFEEYWSKEDVQRGLKNGDLVQGVLRINQRNYEEAFIDDPEGGGDYNVKGLVSRNRALERDVVAIKVLPPDQWQTEQRLQAVAGSQTASSHPTLQELAPSLGALKLDCAESGSTSKTSDTLPTAGPGQATRSGTEVGTAESVAPTTLIDRLYTVPAELRVGGNEERKGEEREEERERARQNDLMGYRRTAKVVYIVERGHSRACAGLLKAFDKGKAQALISPKDNKVPRVIVPLSNCPEDYSQNCKKYESTLFICRITSWERDSPFAQGELLRSMGEAGEIEPETQSFLLENDIDSGEFSPEALDCLPQQRPWTIPQEEEARRRDFRQECVFTIDPETARDLDDALHVKEVEKGVYEVGVHIADVSYFVKEDTALDRVAGQRATSVYLVQRVIPMLPRLLCEQLCSLNPNEDRLAFSVVWTITIDGKFRDEWMGRSIIRSCAKLSYSHAQAMIEEPQRNWTQEDMPAITNGFTASQVSSAVNTLNELAKALRSQRQLKGTLRLNQPKLKFRLSKETGLPNGCDVYIQQESNRLIEEFMLLANMAVAHRIWKAFPDRAMLRRHPMPKEKSAQLLVQRCESLGIQLDVSSAASIQQSLDEYRGSGEDEESNAMQKMVLVSLCSKIMELARYFCTGTVEREADFMHYALNVPRYTHFTSPIRRYADIVVHRQLASALGEGPSFNMIDEEIESQAHHCNKKKKSAKTVEELSMQMFFAIFLRECSPIVERGIVIQVLDKAFDVLVQRYGVIKRVYCEQLPLQTFQATRRGKSKIFYLTLEWPRPDGSALKQELGIMSVVSVELTGSPRPLQYEAKILPPI